MRYLPGHEVHTVVSMHWGGIKNGALLAPIEREAFEIFLTGDKNMQNQQRLKGRSFAVLVLSAINWPVIQPNIGRIALAIDTAGPATVKTIDCGEFIRAKKRDNQ